MTSIARRMHADEIHTDVPLVRRLLAAQFPQWAELSIERVASGGTENAIYRLGEEMAVRLPLKPGREDQVEKLERWLPRLKPLLPLAIPVLLASGKPSEHFPLRWSVYPWLEGEPASVEHVADLGQAATALAEFVATLHRIDLPGGPSPGAHNFFRGVPLAARDAMVRASLDALHGVIDVAEATAGWEAALAAEEWKRPPVWIHGDLKSDNLLVSAGRIRAVIDFGGLGIGDPACDLIIAWDLLSGESRAIFRSALRVDDATWARGKGWALSVALTALPYYLHTNPTMVRYARRLLGELAAP
jgi:aminoglycoside phosphotransferase (APT) family kinase protein